MVEGDNLCAALVAIFLLHLLQLLLHHLLATLGIVQNFLQVGYQLHQVVILLMQLVDTQTCQLAEAHIHDGLRLQLVQVETSLQVTLGITGCLRVADDVHHFVDIVHGNNQALQDVSSLLSLAQVVLRAAYGYVVTMLYEVFNTLLERQQTGATLHQGDVVDRERAL